MLAASALEAQQIILAMSGFADILEPVTCRRFLVRDVRQQDGLGLAISSGGSQI
eukprot:SAG31_NODE_546_length_14230_cov_18.112660_3_plen_54_part_00